MNFGFNEEQELLRSTARKFFENECALRHRAARSWTTPEGITPELWTKIAEQGWLGLDLSRGVRRHGPGPRRPGGAHGGDGPRGGARPVLLHRPPGRPRRPRGGQRGAEEGVAAEDRLGRQARDARLDGAERARSAPPGVTLTAAEKGGALHALRHQALRARRPHRRRARGGGAHAAGRRAPTGVSLFLLPKGTRGARGHAAAHHGPDPQALRGHAHGRRRSAPTRCSGAAGAGWAPLAPRARPRHRRPSAPRCAAAPRRCST